jgi:hypothetical protein
MTPRETFAFLASFTLLTACGGANGSPPVSAEGTSGSRSGAGHQSLFDEGDEAPPFRFGWALPCRVPVTTVATKKGKTIRFSFFLDVRRAGEKVHARFEDMRFLEFEGKDITGPAFQKQLAPALALASAIPTLEVSREGAFERAIGLEELVDRVVAADPKNKDPEKRAAVTRFMKRPEVLATMEAAGGDYWESWVGAWVDFGARPGAPREADTETAVFGVKMPMHVRGEFIGASLQYEGAVHLRITMTIDGDDSPRALEEVVAHMIHEAAPETAKMNVPMPKVARFDKVVVTEVHTDPATLHPSRVSMRTTTNIDLGQGLKTMYDSREETFDWANAKGCRGLH